MTTKKTYKRSFLLEAASGENNSPAEAAAATDAAEDSRSRWTVTGEHWCASRSTCVYVRVCMFWCCPGMLANSVQQDSAEAERQRTAEPATFSPSEVSGLR